MSILAETTTQSNLVLVLLFATGLIAGFVDSIAGGGGLITLPVLLAAGLPPGFALGTNKLQASFGSGSAAWHFAQSGMVSLRECLPGIIFTAIGAAGGTVLVQHLNPAFLKHFIPALLIGIATFMFFKPQLGATENRPRMTVPTFYVLFGLALGFYDGFIGPGVGTFWAMAFILALGFNLAKATANTKVMNLASNLTSLAFFFAKGQILWCPGLAMGLGQLLGAKLGSHLVVTRGVKFIRPIFLSMVLLVSLKLIYDSFWK